MSSLGLNDYEALSPLEPELPSSPKSATKAFLISLLLPGIGQVYAKRGTAGWTTLVFFVFFSLAGIAGLAKQQSTIGWTALFVAVSLYIFGFLDAYFSTLEYNRGISSYLIGGNPRIACILNFLTNGIGYFYIGDRGKGLLMFLGLGVLRQLTGRVVGNPPWLTCAWVLLQVVLAYDAYRVARKRLLESFPQLVDHSWKAASNEKLTPAIPISLAVVVAVPFLGLMGLGAIVQGSGTFNAAALEVTTTPQGTEYSDKKLGLRLLLPNDWQVEQTPDSPSRFEASNKNGDCQVILLRSFSLSSPESFQKDVERELAHKPGFSVFGYSLGTLGELPAALMRVGVGTGVTERVATAKLGLAVYTLFEVSQGDDKTCAAQFDRVRNSFTAKH